MKLADKVVLITGAGRGIGRAVALAFADEGARLALVERDAAALGETMRALERRQPPRPARAIVADLSHSVQAERAVHETLEAFGQLDVLYNNAAVFELDHGDGPTHELDEAVWQRVLAINLGAVFSLCRVALPHMLDRGQGNIINVSSLAGLHGGALAHAYAASKGGVVSLTKSLSRTYAARGVRANCICPGAVDTDMLQPLIARVGRDALASAHALGRLGTPADITGLALYLASDESAWMSGSVIPIDGGARGW